jgi:predicted deacetylase
MAKAPRAPAPQGQADIEPIVHISLHDVAPRHRARIERAEQLFAEWGIPKLSYLLVPDFHGDGRADLAPGFTEFCQQSRRSRGFEVDWLLHGYYHLEGGLAGAPEEAEPGMTGIREAFDRRFMTGGEGEFLSLEQESARELVREGSAVFEAVLGFRPNRFVPPAWLFSPGTVTALRNEGMASFEAHRGICHLPEVRWQEVPVVTWATRTWLRRKASLLVCPALGRLWSGKPAVRLAFHPHDFDHPETVRSIARVVRHMLARRRAVSYAELVAADSPADGPESREKGWE